MLIGSLNCGGPKKKRGVHHYKKRYNKWLNALFGSSVSNNDTLFVFFN